ncbi:MAG: hypothetical protein IT289_04610 [Oligoflexia bacterium]|nr:hypothetical protein [Oligoflexia bacterium]
MSGRILAVVFILGVSAKSSALERELAGVALGESFSKVLKNLESKSGKPFHNCSTKENQCFDFLFEKSSANTLRVKSDLARPDRVGEIAIIGNLSSPEIRFPGKLNLALEDRLVRYSFPNAKVESGAEEKIFETPEHNVRVKSQSGLISEIAIFTPSGASLLDSGDKLVPLDRQEAQTAKDSTKERLLEDPLQGKCAERFFFSDSAKDARIYVSAIHGKTERPLLLQIDPAMPRTILSLEACKKLKCKKEPGNKLTDGTTRKIEYAMGPHVFRPAQTMLLKDVPEGSDGILGSDILFFKEIFINYRQRYLCYPNGSVFELAQGPHWSQVEASYKKGRVWPLMKSGNVALPLEHFLDPVSPTSALLSTRNPASNEDLRLGPIKLPVNTISKTSKLEEARIGGDFLGQSILGFDQESKYFWINP